MRKFLVVFLFLFLGFSAGAQHGSAPSGFYPSNYHGDTFSGVITASGERELTITYNHKGKTELFSGVTDGTCMAASKADVRVPVEMPLTALPKGSAVTLFYNHKKVKQPDGSKKDINVILLIRIDEINGKKYVSTEHPMIPCTKAGWSSLAYH